MTIGEHIRKRRLELHILQKSLAERLCVNIETIKNWERGIEQPMIRHLPAVIALLEFDPEPEPNDPHRRIAYARRRIGWTQEQLAMFLKAGTATVGRWENGKSTISAENQTKFQNYLGNRFQLIPR